MDIHITRFIVRISRPTTLLSGFLVYALGLGIARYLGTPLNWAIASLGQAWVTMFQLGFHFLTAYFLLPTKPRDPTRSPIPTDDEEPHDGLRRDLILWAAFAAFAAVTSLTLIIMQTNVNSGAVLIVMGLIFLSAFLYAVPPFQWAISGYGELIQSIMMANFFPALAFLLQQDELHRLVTMSTFPLTLLYLALQIAVQLPNFLQDLSKGRQTLLIRLGWERGMIFHNILILGGFLLIGVALFFGLPAAIALPTFFVLPLGLFQIWYMTRILAGAKPNWRALNFTAILIFGLTTYLLAFSFWTR
jgi:1,4-dihydroxy-2-naphthoate octaprenyltransferase